MSLSVAPLARSFGMTPPGFGLCTCPSTTVLTALRCRPSATLERKTSSRFGPTMPFVSALASVWQEPHLATNACLPTITSALSAPLTAQPVVPTATAPSRPTATARVRNLRKRPASARHERLLTCTRLTTKHYPNQRLSDKILWTAQRALLHGRAKASSSPRAAASTPSATPVQDQRLRTVETSPVRVRALKA